MHTEGGLVHLRILKSCLGNFIIRPSQVAGNFALLSHLTAVLPAGLFVINENGSLYLHSLHDQAWHLMQLLDGAKDKHQRVSDWNSGSQCVRWHYQPQLCISIKTTRCAQWIFEK